MAARSSHDTPMRLPARRERTLPLSAAAAGAAPAVSSPVPDSSASFPAAQLMDDRHAVASV